MSIERVLLEIAEALRYPVFGLALLALAAVLLEAGGFVIELARRRRRRFARLQQRTEQARAALRRDDRAGALRLLDDVATSAGMAAVLRLLVVEWDQPSARERVPKALADFDLRSLKRLERTRVLVRAGPALGLMGTLIPLSPALSALGRGDVRALAEGLRVAFGVTVVGILIGMVAFTLSLVRDRLYAQDHSDLEYVAASLEAEHDAPVAAAPQGVS